MRQRPFTSTSALTSPIPRAWSSAERRLAGLAPEVAPDALGDCSAIPLPGYAPSFPYLATLRGLLGEERLAGYLLDRHHRTQLRDLAHAVQRVYPRTAPADKRNNRELVSYLARMLTQGRYVAAFDD